MSEYGSAAAAATQDEGVNAESADAGPGLPKRPALQQPQRPLLRRAAACDYLWRVWGIRRAPATLAKLACIGGGPKFRRCGRWPMHAEEDIDQYARDLLGELVESTSAWSRD